MVATYKAIDLCEFYDNIPIGAAYLLVSVPGERESSIVGKIKVTNKRYLDVMYDENGKVKVLLTNAVSEKYHVLDIPCENGEYRLDFLMPSIWNESEPVIYPVWADARKSFSEKIFDVLVSDYAVVFEKATGLTCDTEIHLLSEAKLLNTEILLHRIHYYGRVRSANIDDSLLNKCLCGEQIDIGDFDFLVDFEDEKLYVDIEFDSLVLHSSEGGITVEKPISSAYGINENLSCTISRERLGIISIFVSKIIMEETKKNTIPYLHKYFFT